MAHEQYKTIDHDPDMGLNNKKCMWKDYYCTLHRVYLTETDVRDKKCLKKPDFDMIGFHKCGHLHKINENL